MALVFKDRVKVTTSTTGTGTLTLGSPIAGFQDFSVIGDGNTTYYAITDINTGEWEVGLGIYDLTTDSLVRDTVFESSNAGSLVNFQAGSKNVFVTYAAVKAVSYDAAGNVVVPTRLDVDNLSLTDNVISSLATDEDIVLDPNGTGAVNVSSAKITNVAAPTSDTDAANKFYVDNAIAGLSWKQSAQLLAATNISLTGATGTLTVDSFPALTSAQSGFRLLLIGQSTASQNGIYVYSDDGTNYTLARSADADTFQELIGAAVFIKEGTIYGSTGWLQTVYDLSSFSGQQWVQFSGSGTYTASDGVSLVGVNFSLTDNGVTNAKIRQSGGLSVIGRSANTTGNVADIAAGTDNQVLRRSGTGIGFGAVNLSSSDAITGTLPATNGGTGQNSYTTGDIIYANSGTSLAKLAGVSTGNALISGGASTAPLYGKIGLTTHVTGTLPVANGGTGQTSYTDGQLLIGNSTGNTLTKATLTQGTGIAVTNGSGSITTALTGQALALHNLATNGLIARTGAGTVAGRSLTAGTGISISNGDGVSGNPTISATNNGTVTSVGGTGTVNGISLSGTVTSSGNLTLGGALTGVSLTTQVTGTLPVANGGTGQTTYTNGQLLIGNTTGNTLTKANLTAGTGISITNGTGTISIAATNNGTVTSVASGTGLTGGPITSTGTLSVATNGISNTLLRQSAGLSVIGRSASTTGDVADVTAASDHQVLRRSGTALGFGAVNLASTNAVTGTLPVGNGGTGITSLGTGVATFLQTPSSANLAAAVTDETGTGALVFATSPTLVTPALGTPSSGTLSSCTVDGANEVGFRNIPQNSRSAAYTLVAADSGKHILHPSADTTARTFTIPANGSVAYPVGTAITFINQNGAGVVTIAITTDTMRLAGAGTTGSRTLAANGVATAIKVTSTEWIISGTGLT
jgi:hypothetical protein